MLFIDKNLLFQGPARCLNFTFSYMKIIYEKEKKPKGPEKARSEPFFIFLLQGLVSNKKKKK